jgi:4-amino-4-deoxy-L-arabinose transferase-like glycosyltransferase
MHLAMTKHRYTTVLLTLVLLISAALRLYGLRWDDDLDGYPHPDERHLANTMSRLTIPSPIDWELLLNDPDRSPLNPRKLVPGTDEHYDLAYGTLPVYLYRGAAFLLAQISGHAELDAYSFYRVIGRAITALFAVLTVLWVYLIGRRTFGAAVGLLGAALLATCVLHVQLSHFMTVDLIMSALLTAGLLVAVRFAQGGRTADAFGMGLLMGLGMAAKFNGITVIAGIAAAYAVAWLGGKRTLKDLLSYCLPLTFIGWTLAFGLFEYYAIRDPYTYVGAIGVQARMVSGETDWPYTRQYVNTAPYLFQLRNLVAWGMGWPLGMAAVGGVAVSLVGLATELWEKRKPRRTADHPRHRGHGEEERELGALRAYSENAPAPVSGASAVSSVAVNADELHPPVHRNSVVKLQDALRRWADDPRRAGTLVLLGWAVPFFAYTARLEVKFLRYMLPLTPVLCLFAADLLWRLGGLISEAAPRRALVVLRWVLAILVLLPTALWALAYMRVYAQEHPWQAASRWFYRNAPPGSTYTWEAWGDPLPTNLPGLNLYREKFGFRDVWMHIYHDMPPQDKLWHIAESLRQADYVVLSTPRLYLSVTRLPWRYPVEIRYYELLFSEQLGYELAAKFTARPGLGPWEIDDLSADQSFYDYEHPLVLIYLKTRDLSDEEWHALFAEQLKAEPELTREGDDPPVQLPIP